MKEKKHVISRVLPGSIGEELELVPGDALLSINGEEVEDVLDYRYLLNEEEVTLLVEKADGEIWELDVEKEYEDDLGVEFENGLMDDYRSCSNRCIFCFIDQMPPGMRETLYFKDDDSRLSFLQGNYVTLTNLSDHDMERIIHYHLSPINISFHTMNPELRCRMLRNRFAGESLKRADALYEAGITMNGQIVLCKGINDGRELEYTLKKLSEYAPVLQSVSVVPVGLTRYREGLYPLEGFESADAGEVLALIHRFQEQMMEKWGIHFVHASDEWYLLAGEELPEEGRYDGYPQLENGVGMLRLLMNQTDEALGELTGDDRVRDVTLVTGELSGPYISRIGEKIGKKFPRVRMRVETIRNDFFGPKITVSGLITGRDLMGQLKGKETGEQILIPANMLRSGEDVFLDDVTLAELEAFLGKPVLAVGESGEELLEAVLTGTIREQKRRQMYEQTGSCHCGQAECGEIHPV